MKMSKCSWKAAFAWIRLLAGGTDGHATSAGAQTHRRHGLLSASHSWLVCPQALHGDAASICWEVLEEVGALCDGLTVRDGQMECLMCSCALNTVATRWLFVAASSLNVLVSDVAVLGRPVMDPDRKGEWVNKKISPGPSGSVSDAEDHICHFHEVITFLHGATSPLVLAMCLRHWEDGLSTPSSFPLPCCQHVLCQGTKSQAFLSPDFIESYSLGLEGTLESSLYFCHATDFTCFHIRLLVSS